MEPKGAEREKAIPKSRYYAESYFALEQLCSFAHQINDVYGLRPGSIVEVGIGNGFTSTFLKRAGFEVVTVDINPDLEPDICAPVSELPNAVGGRRFDLAVCCEVLEHMPFEQFEESIRALRAVSDRAYLTLPTFKQTYGVGGLLFLPKMPRILLNHYVEIPRFKKRELLEHCWEVGSMPETSRCSVIQIMKKHYKHVRCRRFALNPYHLAFFASDRPLPKGGKDSL